MRQLESERVGTVKLQLSGYRAFIPHPLGPAGPTLEISNDIIRLISEAERALGELKGITEVLANPDLFVAFYVQKEALLSSQIEGTECTLDEVFQIDEKTDETKPVGEIINYIAAMNYGLENLKRLPISIRLINEIHEKLLHGLRGNGKYPGEIKRSQNWIGPSGCTLAEAAYVPPPPEKTIELLGDLETFYHADTTHSPLIKAAILHAHFETIHPYLDGNGRLGRLLITFMLCEQDILQRPLLYLSLFFKEHKKEYYELLMNVRFKGHWEEWITFFLRGVRHTSLEASKTARELLALQKKHKDQIQSSTIRNLNADRCYEIFLEKPILTINEAMKKLAVSYPTAKSAIEALIILGIVKQYDKAERNKRYSYDEYLAVLKRGT